MTGVQTCALPILNRMRWFPRSLMRNLCFVFHSGRKVRATTSILRALLVKNLAANTLPCLMFWFSKSNVSPSCSERDKRFHSLVKESMAHTVSLVPRRKYPQALYATLLRMGTKSYVRNKILLMRSWRRQDSRLEKLSWSQFYCHCWRLNITYTSDKTI